MLSWQNIQSKLNSFYSLSAFVFIKPKKNFQIFKDKSRIFKLNYALCRRYLKSDNWGLICLKFQLLIPSWLRLQRSQASIKCPIPLSSLSFFDTVDILQVSVEIEHYKNSYIFLLLQFLCQVKAIETILERDLICIKHVSFRQI